MKQKTKKMSIKTKILLLSFVLFFLISMILGGLAIASMKSGMIAMGVEEAEVAAKVAVDAVDSELISKLVPGCESRSEYKQLLSDLRKVQEKIGIKYLYTLYADEGKVYYGVISAYMPVRNAEGEVIAVIGSDYNASDVLAKIKRITVQIVLFTILCEIIAIFCHEFSFGKNYKRFTNC